MKRAILAVTAAAAVVLIAGPAKAFVRSKDDQRAGVCLWWANPAGVPVVANVSSGPKAGGCSSQSDEDALIRSSLATWSQASSNGSTPCTGFRFSYGGQTSSIWVGFDQTSGAHNDNLIVFRHELCDGNPQCVGALSDLEACADQIGCWPHDTLANIATSRTIAITTTSFIPSTGEIVDADMELFDRAPTSDYGYFFTCPNPQPPKPTDFCGYDVRPNGTCVSTDLGSIVTHEAGHMLGLDHTPVVGATMYATYTPGSRELRTLASDDVAGVCTIYPAGGAPLQTCTASTTPTTQTTPKSSGGCSTAGGGVISMLGVALALGRRRRVS